MLLTGVSGQTSLVCCLLEENQRVRGLYQAVDGPLKVWDDIPMAWTLDQIESEWLGGQCLQMPAEDVEGAFAAAERELAEELVRAGALPAKAGNDALHVAVAAIHRVPYLLTWNCRHMANATLRAQIESVCASKGFKAPIICTPEEMMEVKP